MIILPLKKLFNDIMQESHSVLTKGAILKTLPCLQDKGVFLVEQDTGVEPAFTAWEAVVLPIYESCDYCGIITEQT